MKNILLLPYYNKNKCANLFSTYDFHIWTKGFQNIPNINIEILDLSNYIENNNLEQLELDLLEEVEKGTFDYIIFQTKSYEISIEIFKKIKLHGIEIIICFFDDTKRFNNYNLYYIQIADYIITHESKSSLKYYEEIGVKANFFPLYPSHNFFKNKIDYSLKSKYDVSFIGSNIQNREMYYMYLKNKTFNMSFYGKNWDNGYISTQKMIEIYSNSKIILNFNNSKSNNKNKLNPRIFEVCISKGFLLTEYFPEVEDYYIVGKEIEIFKTKEELLEKILYFLENEKERIKIAEAGFKKTKELYTHEIFWAKFLSNIKLNKIPKNSHTKKIDISREHKLNFLMWHIELINTYKNKNMKDKIIFHINKLINSKYYTYKIIEYIKSTSEHNYKIMRDIVTKDHFHQQTIYLEHVNCDLCGGYEYKKRYRLPDLWLWKNQFEFPVVECVNCGLVYINPRPTQKSMSNYYPDDYHDNRDSKEQLIRYENQTKFLPNLKNNKVLDIGCAKGDFLDYLIKKEPSIIPYGVDLFSKSVNNPKINFYNKLLIDCNFKPNYFDIIISFAVFEHLHEPSKYFEEVSNILKKDGDFIILVTNSESLYGKRANIEDIPRHTYHFSEKTLYQYANKYNLKLESIIFDDTIFDGRGKGTIKWFISKMIGLNFEDYYFKKISKLKQIILNLAKKIDTVFFRSHWESKIKKSGIIIAKFKKY